MICEATGKHVHRSRRAAETHVRQLARLKAYEGHPYMCIWCGGWHIGRAKLREHKNKYETP